MSTEGIIIIVIIALSCIVIFGKIKLRNTQTVILGIYTIHVYYWS